MRRGAALVLPAVVLLAAGCGGSGGRSIVVYNGQHLALTRAMVSAFERETGISVRLRSNEGVVLADQVKSLDWRARRAELAARLPDETWGEVIGKLATLLEPADAPAQYRAANYDDLADSPIEAGAFEEYSYVQSGATYRVIVHARPSDYSPDRLMSLLKKITATETALMRDAPFSRYTFIFHFARAGGGGGMEHANGAAISVSGERLRRHPEAVESIAAHEFFHLWNVKRIRPRGLEPVDYVHGNDTQELWFSEGVTSTYGELALLRAGLISRRM